MTTKKDLLAYLFAYQIPVIAQEGKKIFVIKDYIIEIENKGIFKLYHKGYVVAPFDDIQALCSFIKQSP